MCEFFKNYMKDALIVHTGKRPILVVGVVMEEILTRVDRVDKIHTLK